MVLAGRCLTRSEVRSAVGPMALAAGGEMLSISRASESASTVKVAQSGSRPAVILVMVAGSHPATTTPGASLPMLLIIEDCIEADQS